MLAERVARWPKQWRQQGKAELLREQAGHRFGKLPQWVVDRFNRADVDTLERWSFRLLDAERLEDVFDNK